jgi:hypothetical protein
VPLGLQLANHIVTDEASPTSDEKFHLDPLKCVFVDNHTA